MDRHFLMVIFPVILQLLSNLVGNFDHELPIEVELFGQGVGEILRRVIGIIDIPLKPVLQAYVVNLNVEL